MRCRCVGTRTAGYAPAALIIEALTRAARQALASAQATTARSRRRYDAPARVSKHPLHNYSIFKIIYSRELSQRPHTAL